MKIGLFGGTFDPIHVGHLIVADEVRQKMEFEKIIFIPARHPWLKADRGITEAKHRLEMVKLAISGYPYFEVSEAELNRQGPSYTVDTVEEMKISFRAEAELYFIAGSDVLADLPRWKDPERVITLCRIVGVKRPGSVDIDVMAMDSILPEVSSCLIPVGVSQVDVSSTAIRDCVRAGLSIEGMVPPEVEKYIYENKLYLR